MQGDGLGSVACGEGKAFTLVVCSQFARCPVVVANKERAEGLALFDCVPVREFHRLIGLYVVKLAYGVDFRVIVGIFKCYSKVAAEFPDPIGFDGVNLYFHFGGPFFVDTSMLYGFGVVSKPKHKIFTIRVLHIIFTKKGSL